MEGRTIERAPQNGPYAGPARVIVLEQGVDGELLKRSGSADLANRQLALERADLARRQLPDKRRVIRIGDKFFDRYSNAVDRQRRIVSVLALDGSRIFIRRYNGRRDWISLESLYSRFRRAD